MLHLNTLIVSLSLLTLGMRIFSQVLIQFYYNVEGCNGFFHCPNPHDPTQNNAGDLHGIFLLQVNKSSAGSCRKWWAVEGIRKLIDLEVLVKEWSDDLFFSKCPCWATLLTESTKWSAGFSTLLPWATSTQGRSETSSFSCLLITLAWFPLLRLSTT